MKRLLFLSILFGLFASITLADSSSAWYKKSYTFGKNIVTVGGPAYNGIKKDYLYFKVGFTKKSVLKIHFIASRAII